MADILSSFITQVKIGDNVFPVGSSLFGVSSSEANNANKVVNANNLTNESFSTLATGVSIHVKFSNGNTATNSLTLKVGATAAKPIVNPGGDLTWNDNSIITFTYDGTSWMMNGGKTSASVTEGTNSGEIIIDGTTVKPKNIADAAYRSIDNTITENTTSTNIPTSSAVASYVATMTEGITGAMHFIGDLQTLPDATSSTTYETYNSGDVVLVGDKEYVYKKGDTAINSEWILLGDEGSYALKSNTVSVGSASSWNAGTTPTLGTAIDADEITNWNANVPTGATVASGTLIITPGTAAALSYTGKTIPNVTSVGTVPNLTVTDTTVVRP